jgi:hypothetical protein
LGISWEEFDRVKLSARVRSTQLAIDWWDPARFQAVFWAQANSAKAALSRTTHQRVTQTIRNNNNALRIFSEGRCALIELISRDQRNHYHQCRAHD